MTRDELKRAARADQIVAEGRDHTPAFDRLLDRALDAMLDRHACPRCGSWMERVRAHEDGADADGNRGRWVGARRVCTSDDCQHTEPDHAD